VMLLGSVHLYRYLFSFFFVWWESFLVVSLLSRICCIGYMLSFVYICLDVGVGFA
jgi:hypothetical protein